MKTLKIRLIIALGNLLGVPVQVGYSFLAKGKNSKKPSPGELI